MPDIESNRDVAQILDLCEQIERCNADIYRVFANLFNSDPEMAQLWNKTANEEENHALQFSLAKKLRNLKAVEDTTIDLTIAKNVLSFVKDLRTEFTGKDLSQIEAVLAALELEEKLAEFHACSVAIFVDNSFKKLFTAMLKADRQHIESIHKYHNRLMANGGK